MYENITVRNVWKRKSQPEIPKIIIIIIINVKINVALSENASRTLPSPFWRSTAHGGFVCAYIKNTIILTESPFVCVINCEILYEDETV